jgi:excisionase family DNA binding protein
MTALVDHTVMPPESYASGPLAGLADALENSSELRLVTADGDTFVLTDELREVLAHASQALSRGQAVTLEPRRVVLSTQEAANLLGVSRPTVVSLLKSGQIPYTQPGRHRRIKLDDILEYQHRIQSTRRDILAAMGTEAAQDNAYGHINGFTETR